MDYRDRQGLKGDTLAAFVLAFLLAAVWTVRDWHQLSALRLPDTDDVMRLQQIRDWLGGQRFSDLAQHRLGAPPGLAMHWSRLPDLVPGGIIAGLTPLIGRHMAEMTAVIVWPAVLLTAALLLTARIARALGGAEIARTALIVAAIAYPTTTIFLPGRIDHHGLQVVLLLIVVHALVHAPDMSRGLTAGLAAALSIAIGLETTPLIAAAGVVLVMCWVWGRRGADDALMGFGIALAAGLLAANTVLKTEQFDFAGCDGFTATVWRASQFAAFGPIVLAIAGHASARRDVRAALAVALGATSLWGLWLVAPACLSPYGGVDPLLARLWLGNVGEAQPLFAARPEIAIGYAGLMVAGIAASLWCWRTTRDAYWAVLLAFQLAALVLTLAQLRGAYAGAILAAPALAAVIAVARRRGALWLAAAWLGSAGMLYPIAANAFVPQAGSTSSAIRMPAGPGCTSPEALAALAGRDGRLIAPLDLGAYALASTRLAVVGAPYHRNNAGNLAVYRFFLGTPDQARSIAQAWRLDYVALCLDSFDELGEAVTGDRHRLLGQLRQGRIPPWMRPIGRNSTGLTLFTLEPRLFAPHSSR
ncbi:hypothetical protein [Sphingomonas sp. ERG5]|uniref:hypothetical protein n=1 Tax=Sphingomonas sp. ERG5 TaxID=1381597 RepID=UPI00068CB143|nr:hypothetical protein [Sphingomonas sp. ERG5]